jgi:hypothetical protein
MAGIKNPVLRQIRFVTEGGYKLGAILFLKTVRQIISWTECGWDLRLRQIKILE